jgi:hypothetical protein
MSVLRQPIPDEDYATVFGRVFVTNTFDRPLLALQVVGRTRFYVRARPVPMVPAQDARYGEMSHHVAWDTVEKPAPGSDTKEHTSLYSLTRPQGAYCISRAKENIHAYMVDDGDEHGFLAVEY